MCQDSMELTAVSDQGFSMHGTSKQKPIFYKSQQYYHQQQQQQRREHAMNHHEQERKETRASDYSLIVPGGAQLRDPPRSRAEMNQQRADAAKKNFEKARMQYMTKSMSKSQHKHNPYYTTPSTANKHAVFKSTQVSMKRAQQQQLQQSPWSFTESKRKCSVSDYKLTSNLQIKQTAPSRATNVQ